MGKRIAEVFKNHRDKSASLFCCFIGKLSNLIPACRECEFIPPPRAAFSSLPLLNALFLSSSSLFSFEMGGERERGEGEGDFPSTLPQSHRRGQRARRSVLKQEADFGFFFRPSSSRQPPYPSGKKGGERRRDKKSDKLRKEEALLLSILE